MTASLPRAWADGPLVACDLETTGTNTSSDRIVTATVVTIEPGQAPAVHTWLADPGIDIPAQATHVHGITTEHARTHGRPAAEVVDELATLLARVWQPQAPLCVFNAPFDLSLLHTELDRHHGRALEITGAVVDPRCLDRHVDRYRPGKRTLGDLCTHYRVRHDGAHDSTADALACARLAWRLAKVFPDQVGQRDLAELHHDQIDWHRSAEESFADYLHRRARGLDDPAQAEQLRHRAEQVRAHAQGWPLTRVTTPAAV